MSARLPRLTFVLPLALLALATSACAINLDAAKYTDREERRFTVSGKPEIVLSTFDGAIDVKAWDRPEVLVTVEKQADNAEAAKKIVVAFAQDGNRITVEIKKPEAFEGVQIGMHTSRSASVTIMMPKDGDLQARSGDGSITLAGITGRIDVKSGDGGIKGTSLDGDLTVHTGDGAVTLDDVKGRLELSTGDGGVNVKGALSRVKARTGDGGVTIRALPGSTTGDDWEITTGDGAMTVELPAGFAAEVDAHTGDGGISVEGLTHRRREARRRAPRRPEGHDGRGRPSPEAADRRRPDQAEERFVKTCGSQRLEVGGWRLAGSRSATLPTSNLQPLNLNLEPPTWLPLEPLASRPAVFRPILHARRPRTPAAAPGTCCRRRSARRPTGFMHDSVSSSGTPSASAAPDHVLLVQVPNGVAISMA